MDRRIIPFSAAVALAWLLATTGCRSVDRITYPRGATEPLLGGLGDHHFQVTTESRLAQNYINQGLVLRYGFAFEAARKAFEQAAALDPQCAMAWWGVAWSLGPSFWSADISEENARLGAEAVLRAQDLKGDATLLEQELIDAISLWYPPAPSSDRSSSNRAYSDAMAELWRAHPDQTEVGSLYAQALVTISGMGLWRRDAHESPDVRELVQVLEAVLAEDPDHPGANHFLIHALEASPRFREAQRAADRLRSLAPGMAHLVHMPSHIDVRAGNWEAAIEANERANALTERYRRALGTDIYSPVWTHNYHFLAFACMMGGQYERGVQAGSELAKQVLADRLATGPLDRWAAVVLYEILVRFGKWQVMLAEARPPEDMPFVTTMWHYARAVSFAALGAIEEAEREYSEFQAVFASIPAAYSESARPVYNLADLIVQGEIAFHRGDVEEAIRRLRDAVELEDGAEYSEPPLWHQPARHALGAILVTAGRFDEAEDVYREDLRRWPNNGWSLRGLETCLRARGAPEEAAEVQAEFERAWASADTEIAASCMCVLRE